MTHTFSEVTSLIGSIILVIGFYTAYITLGYQAYYWLRYEEWVSIPLSKVLNIFNIHSDRVLNTDGKGAQDILIWLLQQPFSAVIFITTLLMGSIIVYLSEDF